MIQKPTQDNRPAFAPDAVSFVPLGGCGQFGCNMSVYHCNGKFLIVDCGIGFPEDNHLGLDILLPDPAFLVDVQKDIVGMVITHAHDDHKGAIAALWPRLNCPIYATPFVIELLRPKLAEWNLEKRVTLKEVPLASTINLAPFKIEFIDTAHSVVESSMLLVETPHGKILHTGDWRLDDNPVEGRSTNIARLKELANENILAVIGDSTNAVVAERHPSEMELQKPLAEFFKTAPGRVIVTTFSHSVPRIRTVYDAAKASGRRVGMIGRSMVRVQEAARKFGYLQDVPPFLADKEMSGIAPRGLVVLATGSQGEPGSAIQRLAIDDHPAMSLVPGDTVVFSAREIPGNEKLIQNVCNSFSRRGIAVVMPETGFTHASGHAYADEMADLFSWVKPKTIIPVHGSEENQVAQVAIARATGIPFSIIPVNGDIIALRDSGPEKTGQVLSGLMAVDGVRVVPVRDSLALKERHRVANEGIVSVTVVVDDQGDLLHDPVLSINGLGVDEEDAIELENMLYDDIEQAVAKAQQAKIRDYDRLQEEIRLTLRRRIRDELGKKPILNVHLLELS